MNTINYPIGIDISEHNGSLDFSAIKAAGIGFVIVRLGWGRRHLDSLFYEHINGAIAAGLPVGVYYYSYARTEAEAEEEALFTGNVLVDSGLSPDRLPMGIWYDMEDADGWKAARGLTEREDITVLCEAYLDFMKYQGFPAGIYASYHWLTEKIDRTRLPEGTPYWCAQWGNHLDFPEAKLWQYTDRLTVCGKRCDGNRCV